VIKLDEVWGIYKQLWQRFPDLVLMGASLSGMVGICLAYLITH
jgi:hypothetical protein